MIITWVDSKSCLTKGSKIFRAGDIVPAGVIPESRIAYFVGKGQIEIDEPAKVEPGKVEQEIKSYYSDKRGKKSAPVSMFAEDGE